MTNQLTSASTQDAYNVYRSLFRQLRENHPQRMELDWEEFTWAVNHPKTVKATVWGPGRSVEIPVLVPIEVNKWLNSKFFTKYLAETRQGGSDTETGELLHLTMWQDTELSSQVKQRLVELSRQQGFVVLDGPGNGLFSVKESLNWLQAVNGVCVRDIQLVGTQTYWAGQVKNSQVDCTKRPKSMTKAAQDLGVVKRHGGEGAGTCLRLSLTENEIESMHNLYYESYDVLSDHPGGQVVSPQEFLEMMTDGSAFEKLTFERNGNVESISVLTSRLDQLGWINVEYYQKHYWAKYEQGAVVCVPVIATDPTSAGAHNAGELVDLMGRLFAQADNCPVVLFDTPDVNSAFLPKYLTVLICGLKNWTIEFNPIATHEYYVVSLQAASES